MIPFSLDELLQVAEQIERNGARFYRAAAEEVQDEGSRKVLLDLAAMEDTHLVVFSQMREALTEKEKDPTAFDPYEEAELYLKAFAGGHVFDLKTDPCEVLKSCGDVVAILRVAIDLEKDSIVFYLAMKSRVPSESGKKKIDAIMMQEMGHVLDLKDKLDSID